MGTQILFTDNGIELNHIKDSDHKMAYLIDRIGNCTLNLRTNLFQSLIRIIIEQLSIKAARTIWRRIESDLDEVSPEQIIAAPDDKLRSLGLSRQKISYTKYLSDTVLSDKLNLESMHDLSDKEVLELLTKIKGIGRWSAEMFMIFSLGRLDIFSADDVGLKRAAQWLYDLAEQPSKETMQEMGEVWKPYRTVASLYLWEAVNKGMLKS